MRPPVSQNKQPPSNETPSLTPWGILQAAVKAVPVLKYALGVLGIVCVIAIIEGFRVDLRVAMFGVPVMVIFMVVLIVLSALVALGKKELRLPALVLVWACTILIIVSAIFLFTSLFFDYPKSIPGAFGPEPPIPSTGNERLATHGKADPKAESPRSGPAKAEGPEGKAPSQDAPPDGPPKVEPPKAAKERAPVKPELGITTPEEGGRVNFSTEPGFGKEAHVEISGSSAGLPGETEIELTVVIPTGASYRQPNRVKPGKDGTWSAKVQVGNTDLGPAKEGNEFKVTASASVNGNLVKSKSRSFVLGTELDKGREKHKK